ncbi:hypothetical protein Tco_0147333, partial [Tanacetum coccineum]
MHSRFEMSLMGEMKFILGLQIHQTPRDIFINQAKYDLEILEKYGMEKGQSIGTPMATKPKLDADLSGEPMDVKMAFLNGMEKGQSIGTPMATKPKLDADLSDEPVDQTDYHSKIGSLMYPKGSGFELTAFSDADHVDCLNTRKSTSGGIQFL